MRTSAFIAGLTASIVLAAVPASATAAAKAPQLRAGVGRADITPPKTGYYLGGWTRADRLALGQGTRLFSNALVLQRGKSKLALVGVGLFGIPAGMQEEIAKDVADLGFDKTTVLLQADHTHSGPGGFANNPVYNTSAPSLETIDDPASFVNFFNAPPADKQLYTFLEQQIVQSIRRADHDLGAATAGWGHTMLYGLTQNRSIEAHLENYGIHKPLGQGTPEMDPNGVNNTIDPNVDVLRVDKLVRRKGKLVHMPIGTWSTFADHGTTVHSEFQAYSGDHQGAATRVFTARVREAGKVPASQAVISVFPNSDEGDQTAGIKHVGPAAADFVGRVEAASMFSAWKSAGKKMSRTPVLDVRWTRSCFCGRSTATGPVASSPEEGLPFLTGSEEGRGPLFDITGIAFEGVTLPISDPVQGSKVPVPIPGPPPAVPLSIVRVGDRAITAIPAEPTKEVGSRVREAVLAALAPAGVKSVVIGGLANDYIQYITTPEEYVAQSYEAGSTLYGKNEATFVQERLVELAKAMVAGTPAAAAYPLDTSYGIRADGPRYPAGAASGAIVAQPKSQYARLGHATFSWKGAPNGLDRPVDAAFISVQRKTGSRWRTVTSDLGTQFVWRVNADGRYDATWEVPRNAPQGTYRLVVTATRYTLTSDPFGVVPLTGLPLVETSAGKYELRYPPAIVNTDITYRPVGVAVTPAKSGVAKDRWGNSN